MVKLQINKTNDIPVRELKDGQIGVITGCPSSGRDFAGDIIQRHEQYLISIGRSSEYSWNHIPTSDDFRVRILGEGETLVITNNQ